MSTPLALIRFSSPSRSQTDIRNSLSSKRPCRSASLHFQVLLPTPSRGPNSRRPSFVPPFPEQPANFSGSLSHDVAFIVTCVPPGSSSIHGRGLILALAAELARSSNPNPFHRSRHNHHNLSFRAKGTSQCLFENFLTPSYLPPSLFSHRFQLALEW